MRVIIGLAALVALNQNVNAQQVSWTGSANGIAAVAPSVGTTAQAAITVRIGSSTGAFPTATPALGSGLLTTNNWIITTPTGTSAVNFQFQTNPLTGQLQYRYSPNYPSPAALYPNSGLSAQSYTCDPCAGSTPITCNTATGPGASPSPPTGFPCANLNRYYQFSGLQPSKPAAALTYNSFAVQVFDINTNPAPNSSSYSFNIVVLPPAVIVGDPQIVGMQGQDFQVHGIPDEIFNLVTYPSIQVNARFTYLESASCHDNFTACFAHPGTYITEEGFLVGKDRIRVTAGSFKKGLTVHVNSKKIASNVDLKKGAVEIVNHRRVVVHTDMLRFTLSNSDRFMNQEIELMDDQLVSLGARRVVLKDNERFHPEVPLHGLQGQTWRNVEYPSGLDYEGSITDYHVTDGNLFGTDFVFNQYKLSSASTQDSASVDAQ